MKIGVLTNFGEMNSGYSLTGIVKDQITMLQRYGHDAKMFVLETYNNKNHPDPFFDNLFPPVKKVPFAHLIDYRKRSELTDDHKKTIEDTKKMVLEEMSDYDFIFTHDFVFTGWNLPYGEACRLASLQMPNTKWLHWVHSVPSNMKDWWDIKQYSPNNKLIFPNKTDRIRVAEQFRGHLDHVRVIPHIKDIRSWMDFSDETNSFINMYPGVMQSDVVMVLPASSDRMEAKGVREVIFILSAMKRQGISVCLVIANQWATNRARKQDMHKYINYAQSNGLEPDKDIIFTSLYKPPKYETGIPKRFLRELFNLSNLFIFPTREESFGLVVPEASLAGGCYMVLNKSLQMQREISGNHCLYMDFGSYSNDHNPAMSLDKYYLEIALIILGRMYENESIMTKTFMRKQYNYDNIYKHYYEPIMAESKTWK